MNKSNTPPTITISQFPAPETVAAEIIATFEREGIRLTETQIRNLTTKSVAILGEAF